MKNCGTKNEDGSFNMVLKYNFTTNSYLILEKITNETN